MSKRQITNNLNNHNFKAAKKKHIGNVASKKLFTSELLLSVFIQPYQPVRRKRTVHVRKKVKKGIWELNASPGFKQQQQSCSVSPQAPFFSSSASQRVRAAESAQHRWKCHHVVYAILGFFILLRREEGVRSATWIPSLSHLYVFPLGGGKKKVVCKCSRLCCPPPITIQSHTI